jgi:hypothetical protein
MRSVCRILAGKPEGKMDLGADGRIILERILEK